MIRRDGTTSQEYRYNLHQNFKLLRDGVYGGYRKGVTNGPAPSRKPRKKQDATS